MGDDALMDQPSQSPPPPPAPAYIYSDEFLKFNYGPTHPLRVDRLALAHELIRRCGLYQTPFTVVPASYEDLAEFHDRHYLATLRQVSNDPSSAEGLTFGLGGGDNPVFKGLYEWSCLLAGGSLQAGDMVSVLEHQAAFNMAGGMHHALAGRAAGFCYVNDPVLVIRRLLAQGRRVAYVDLDAHHGDGVQWAFYSNPRVLTISLHQHPATLFPGTGYREEMGSGSGRGFAVNIPLWPDTDDDIYTWAFDQVVPPLLEVFRPHYVVTQLGVDALMDDPLANLNLTTRGFGHCLRSLRKAAEGRWIALGGGGYDLINVARGWTLVWAVILGREDELPEYLPPDMLRRLELGSERRRLLDDEQKIHGRYWGRAQREAEETVDYLQRNLFPLVNASRL